MPCEYSMVGVGLEARRLPLVSDFVGSDPIDCGPIGENAAPLEQHDGTGLKIMGVGGSIRSCPPSSGIVWHNGGTRESRHLEPADGPHSRSARRSSGASLEPLSAVKPAPETTRFLVRSPGRERRFPR